jgi:PadR family transcriptional regulator PadR
MKVGTVSMWVLLLLSDRSMYGYEIIKELGRRFLGFWTPKTGTVYPALEKLEKEGLVKSKVETREVGLDRKHYTLTAAGKSELLHLTSHWAKMFEMLEEYMQTHKSHFTNESKVSLTEAARVLAELGKSVGNGAIDSKLWFGTDRRDWVKLPETLSLRISSSMNEEGIDLQVGVGSSHSLERKHPAENRRK